MLRDRKGLDERDRAPGRQKRPQRHRGRRRRRPSGVAPQHHEGVRAVQAFLGLVVERADRIDVVAQELDAIRTVRVGGKNVHEPAADGERARGFDHVLALVIGVGQPRYERFEPVGRSGRHVARVARERDRVGRALNERLDRGDHDRAPAEPPGRERVGHDQTLARDVVTGERLVLAGKDLPLRKQRDVAGMEHRKVRVQVGGRVDIAGHHERHARRPARATR